MVQTNLFANQYKMSLFQFHLYTCYYEECQRLGGFFSQKDRCFWNSWFFWRVRSNLFFFLFCYDSTSDRFLHLGYVSPMIFLVQIYIKAVGVLPTLPPHETTARPTSPRPTSHHHTSSLDQRRTHPPPRPPPVNRWQHILYICRGRSTTGPCWPVRDSCW